MGQSHFHFAAGCGASNHCDSFRAGCEAAQQALSPVKEHPIAAVLVFASVSYNLQELLGGIHTVVGEAPIIGSTTAGEILDGPRQKSVVVAALASPFLRLHAGLGQGVSGDWRRAVAQALSSPGVGAFFSLEDRGRYQELTRHGISPFALLFSPGNTQRADSRSFEILEELKRLSGGLMPIAGGSSADDWRMEVNYVLMGQRAFPDSLLVAVFETQLRFGVALSHGFRPTSRRATVTCCSGHEILELDGRPAADVLPHLIERSKQELTGKHISLTTRRVFGSPDPFGEYSINVASYLTDRGGVRFAQPCSEGTSLVVMEMDKEGMISSGQRAVHKALLRSATSDPAFILAFSCALRTRILGEQAGDEIAGVKELLPHIPVAGFYSFGEQGIADDGANRHNNMVISVLVLGKDLSFAAQTALENRRLHKELEQRIQEEKRIKAKIIRTKEEWQRTFDVVPDLIAIIDKEHRIVRVNKAMAKALGITPKNAVASTCYELVHGDTKPPPFCPHARLLRDGREHSAEVHEDRLNGDFFVTVSPFYDEKRRLVGSVHVARNITERKRAEQALLESEQKYRQVVEGASNVGILVLRDGKIVFANQAILNFLGFSREELLSFADPFELIHPEDRQTVQEQHMKRLRGEEGPPLPPYRVITKEGDVKWVEVTGTRTDWNGRPATLNFFIDVTQRVQAEEEKRRLETRLLESQKLDAIATLAGGIAHQFNNALSVIMGNMDLLEMDATDPSSVSPWLAEMKRATLRMSELTNQLLAYARGGKYLPRVISMSRFVRDTLPLISHSLKPSIQLETDLPRDTWSIEADLAQLQMVLSAILCNASEAIEGEGRIRISCRNERITEAAAVRFPELRPGRYVCLHVEDNGKGMDEETRKRIFEPFFSTKFQGRGLSMAAVFGIVRNHHGWIAVESESGKGTAVRLWLPVAEPEKIEPREPEPKPRKSSETILVVEDEQMVMDLVRTMLERLGYRTVEAKTGKEAIEIAKTYEGEIALAIVDLILPDMNSKELYDALIDARPNLKVIVSSGYSIDGPAKELLAAGAQGFIQKPFSLAALSAHIKEVLEGG